MNNPDRHDLFITSVWSLEIPNFAQINKNLLKYTFEDSEGGDKNIYGGKESMLKSNEWLQGVLYAAEVTAKKIADFMGVLKEAHEPKVSCFWGNINKQKEFNPPHVHPSSDLSGCYYVKIPTNGEGAEDQEVPAGKICFHDTRLEKSVSTPFFDENLGYMDLANYSFPKGQRHNPWLDNVVKFQPREGMMIIFPSWLLHYVEPNLCEDDRIAISFNISF
tara:strand:- start:496 stop:1152 length:657 start_codon:yes stop_codon:yes gene_type:complete